MQINKMKLLGILAFVTFLTIPFLSWAAPSFHTLGLSDVPMGPENIVYDSGFEPVAINDRGDAAFRGFYSADKNPTASVDDFGIGESIWKEVGGNLRRVAHIGETAPIVRDCPIFSVCRSVANYLFLNHVSINNNSEVAFSAKYEGIYYKDEGVFRETGDEVGMVIREYDLDPDHGGRLFPLSATHVDINDNGDLAFHALHYNGVSNEAVWQVTNSTLLSRVVVEGEIAPGTGGQLFTGFGRIANVATPLINQNSEVIFGANLSGDIGNPDGVTSLWKTSDTGLVLLLDTGDSAPELNGQTFTSFFKPTINDNGDIVVTASLSNGGSGIFKITGTTVSMMVLAGDSVPGNPGTTFDSVDSPYINDKGDMAFSARLSSGDYSIWIRRASGQLEQVVGEGDLIDVAPGDIRVVVSNELFIGGLNDLGQLALQMGFHDGTQGAFTASTNNLFVSMVTGSPIGISQTFNNSDSGALLSFDYFFETGEGILQILLDGVVVDSIENSGGIAGNSEFSKYSEWIDLTIFSDDGLIKLEFIYNDINSGSILQLDNITFPGLLNGGFDQGLSGFEVSGDGTISLGSLSESGPTPDPELDLEGSINAVIDYVRAQFDGKIEKKLVKKLEKIIEESKKGKINKACKAGGKVIKEVNKLIKKGLIPMVQGQHVKDSMEDIDNRFCS